MMDELIEEKIHNLLHSAYKKSLLPQTFYAIAPQNYPSPFMVFTTVAEITADVLGGQNDTTSTIQLDSYATNPFAAKVSALSALKHLAPLAPATVNASGSFEEETKLFRYQLEFSVIY